MDKHEIGIIARIAEIGWRKYVCCAVHVVLFNLANDGRFIPAVAMRKATLILFEAADKNIRTITAT